MQTGSYKLEGASGKLQAGSWNLQAGSRKLYCLYMMHISKPTVLESTLSWKLYYFWCLFFLFIASSFRKHNVFCLSLPSCISYFIYSCCLSNASLRVLKKSAKHMTGYLGGRERNHFLSERTQERTDAVVSLTLYNLKVKPTNLVIRVR